MKSRLFITVLLALVTLGLSTGASAVSWTMTKTQTIGAGTHPASVAVADLNGDGVPDVAVADKIEAGQIVVRLGKPGGHFTKSRIKVSGDRPVSVVAADFNEDGKMDLAVAGWATNDVRIYLGKGDGKFTLAHPAITGLGANPVHLRAADLDGDGHQDLVVACFNSTNLYVVHGNGDGTFGSPVPYPVGTNPRHVCIADFNRDGSPDIAVTLWGEDKVAVLINDGSGTFDTSSAGTAFKKYAAGKNPLAVEAADLNGDGDLDLAISDFKNNAIKILKGNGDGTFSMPPAGQAPSLAAGGGPQELVLKDLDGDGNIDIAAADSTANSISVFRGRGDGTFRARKVFRGGAYPAALASGDFDRNGLPDLLTGDFTGSHITVYRSLSTSVGFWSYSSIPSVSLTAGTNPSALLADDFDYDGVMDIAVANKGSNNISVLLNRKFKFGNMSGMFGNFSSAVNTPASGAPASFASLSAISAPSGIASGVFTNMSSANNPVPNYRAGLAVANSGNNTVAILLPAGGGTFVLPGSAVSPQRLFAGLHPSAIKMAEFTKDKKTDVAVCNQDDGTVTVFLGNGDGTFGDGKGAVSQSGTAYTVGDGPVSLAVGDFNADGIMDIAVANSGKGSGGSAIGSGNGSISILFGKGDGNFGAAKTRLNGVINPSSIAAAPGGNLVITEANGTATVLKNNGSGVFSPGKNPSTVGASPTGVLAEDVTDDRRSDVVTANSGDNTISLVRRKASGALDTPVDFPAGTAPVALAAHDFNGDGATDLAVADAGDMNATPPDPGGVTVLFGRDIATLTVNITGSGAVSVQSKAEGTQTATASSTVFQEEGGRELVLSATPADSFLHWEGDLTGSKNPAFLEMKTNTRKVTAVFRSAP
jgi:FG-GAP-like repeat/FG-GAP repeat